LLKEIITFYFTIHTKHLQKIRWQNVEVSNVKVGGLYSILQALNLSCIFFSIEYFLKVRSYRTIW